MTQSCHPSNNNKKDVLKDNTVSKRSNFIISENFIDKKYKMYKIIIFIYNNFQSCANLRLRFRTIFWSVKRLHIYFFQFQQLYFCINATTVSSKTAVFSNDSMTWNYNRNRICTNRTTNCL